MLKALENLDRRTAQAALAYAITRVIPARFREGAFHEAPTDDAAAAAGRVFEEAVRRVEGKSARNEEQRRELIRDVLSEVLTEIAFANVNVAATRARRGQQGFLPVTLCQVDYSKFFEKYAKVWGVTRTHAEDAVRRYDDVQHLMPRYAPLEYTFLASLFIKTPATRGLPYTVLIDAGRYGERLTIDAALRIYHDDVDLVGTSSPLDILTRFLGKYGHDIEVEGHVGNPITNLLVNTTGRDSFSIRVLGLNESFLSPTVGRNSSELLLHYVLNFTAYGVRHEPPSESQVSFKMHVRQLGG
jgi:hypothetical protein